jgi:type I restriction enzyme R subunit
MGRRQPERIEWSPYYNALIGGRGTGKSTVVHALRLAYRREDDLNPFPDKDSPKAVFDAFRNTARGTDGAGALLSDTEILVELVRDGLKHRITWRFGTQGDSVDDWDGTGWVVERFSQLEAWNAATVLETPEAIKLLGGLPTGLEDGGEEAKRFDLLVLNLQLAVLRKDAGWERLQDRMIAIAHALALKGNIPMVAAQIELIHDICSDLWWEGLTLPMLEQARRKLRDLVKLMDRVDRKVLYTDFTDELGEEKISEPVYVPMGVNMERFRAKARQFLLAHENHFTIHRLRMNEPLTPMDLEELEHMLREAGLGSEDELEKAKQESHGLGLFVRSLIGLDRAAAKAAFAGFLQGSTLNASQIDFLETLINHLTEHGAMDPALLYESPYTDINPMGVEGVFNPPQVETLLGVLAEIRRRAVA